MLKVHWIRALVLIIAVVGLLGVSGKSGAAQSTLTIDYLSCYSLGGGIYECDVQVSGGTPPYTYIWLTTPFISMGDSIYGDCRVGRTQVVGFNVTDSNGETASLSTSFLCTSEPQ